MASVPCFLSSPAHMQAKAEWDGQKKKKKRALNNIFVVWRKLLEATCLQSLPGDTEEEGWAGGGGREGGRWGRDNLLCYCAQVYQHCWVLQSISWLSENFCRWQEGKLCLKLTVLRCKSLAFSAWSQNRHHVMAWNVYCLCHLRILICAQTNLLRPP